MKNKYFDILKEEGLSDTDEEEIVEVAMDEEKDKRLEKDTLKTVYLCMGLLCLAEALLLILLGNFFEFFRDILSWILGLTVGVILGGLWFFSMYLQIKKITDEPEKQSNWFLKIGAMIRIAVLIGFLCLAYFTRWMNPIGLLLGVADLKLAALSAPLFLKKKVD